MNVLVIVAHPDDEVLGAGGYISRLAIDNNVYTYILGEGVASRGGDESTIHKEQDRLYMQALEANKIMGVKQVFFNNLPDNRFDTIPLLDIIKSVEKLIEKINPELILTHHHGDLNIDHRITHEAVMTAVRPVGTPIKKVMAFEILSSTEWNSQNSMNIFTPNTYINIDDYIYKKIEAMKVYKSEIREYPHPRSEEGIKTKAALRGMESGLKYAEAFEVLREIIL